MRANFACFEFFAEMLSGVSPLINNLTLSYVKPFESNRVLPNFEPPLLPSFHFFYALYTLNSFAIYFQFISLGTET